MERRWGDDADDERDESADSGDESAGDEAENDEAQAKFVEETRLEWSQLGARDAQIRDEAAAGASHETRGVRCGGGPSLVKRREPVATRRP
jgi:hypothetical protein